MSLLNKQDLIREHWRSLLRAAEEANLSQHALLGVLDAGLAEFLATQPENASSEWIADLDAHVQRLRSRLERQE